MKVLFVAPSLVGGGAERNFVRVINGIDRTRFAPRLVLFEKKGVLFSSLADDVPVVVLQKRSRWSFPRLVVGLARMMKREEVDVMVPCMEYANIVCLMAAVFRRRARDVVPTVHNDPAFILRTGFRGKIKKYLYKLLYPLSGAVTACSNGVKRGLLELVNLPESRVKVVFNGVDLDLVARKLSEPDLEAFPETGDLPLVLTCGRLDPQKNHPLLLRAFKMVLESVDARLLILGEGSQRRLLEGLIRDLGISGRVELPGFKSNPYYYMGRCDVFVLSSDAEGFANVIIEAMACGAPVVSTRCPYGPDEIIVHGENGLLVPMRDVGALADMILKVLKNDPLRRKLAAAAMKRVEKYPVDTMVRGYADVFAAVARKKDLMPDPDGSESGP